jgi:uncharacterized phage protein gp47/JayE
LPELRVTVEGYLPQYISLAVTVRIKSNEFVTSEVEAAVESALLDYFKLENSKLGQSLYLSEVYKVVEAVKGVENSICVLNDDAGLQVINADNRRSVVFFDLDNGSELSLRAEEYAP